MIIDIFGVNFLSKGFDFQDFMIKNELFVATSKHGDIRVGKIHDPTVAYFQYNANNVSSFHCDNNEINPVVALAKDHDYIISTGQDGIVLVHQLSHSNHNVQQRQVNTVASIGELEVFPEVHTSSIHTHDEISSPKACSMEESKREKKEQKKKTNADQKKESIRKMIHEMKKEFQQLMHLNQSLPKNMQFTDQELDVDPEYTQILLNQKQDWKEKVRQECAENSQKIQSQRNKVKAAYFDHLDYEHIVISALKRQHLKVQTFVTPKLPKVIQERIVNYSYPSSYKKFIEPFAETAKSSNDNFIHEKEGAIVCEANCNKSNVSEKGNKQIIRSTFEIRKVSNILHFMPP